MRSRDSEVHRHHWFESNDLASRSAIVFYSRVEGCRVTLVSVVRRRYIQSVRPTKQPSVTKSDHLIGVRPPGQKKRVGGSVATVVLAVRLEFTLYLLSCHHARLIWSDTLENIPWWPSSCPNSDQHSRDCLRFRQRARCRNLAEFAVLSESQAAESQNAIQLFSFRFKVIPVADVPHRIHDMSYKPQDVVGTTISLLFRSKRSISAILAAAYCQG